MSQRIFAQLKTIIFNTCHCWCGALLAAVLLCNFSVLVRDFNAFVHWQLSNKSLFLRKNLMSSLKYCALDFFISGSGFYQHAIFMHEIETFNSHKTNFLPSKKFPIKSKNETNRDKNCQMMWHTFVSPREWQDVEWTKN